MSNAKSTRIIAIGIGVLVVGAALLFLVLHKNKSSNKPAATGAAVATTTVAPGSVSFAPAATTPAPIQFTIPKGQNAVAIPMDYFAGGGGYVRQGDQINIYTLINKDCNDKVNPAAVKLIFSNVKVLEVLGSQPAASGTASSFLLAMTPQDAEKLIFNAKFAALYFTLTTNSEPSVATSGISCTNYL